MNSDDPALQAVQELRDLVSEPGWRPLPGAFGAFDGVLIYMRSWPDDSVDTLAVTGPAKVVAERTNPDGCPVWRKSGELAEVIAELRAVPPPGQPGAPEEILPAYGGLA